MTLEEEDRAYPDALRTALEQLDLTCRDGLQLIGERKEHGFAGSGVIDGQPVIVRFADSAQRDHWSGVLVESPLALDMGLSVEPKGFVRTASHIAVDHEACNDEYDICGDEPARVRALLGAEVCRALHALGSLGGDVHLSDSKVEVHQTWGFLEVAPTLHCIARLARLVADSAAAVPPPAALAGAVESWQAYADAQDLTFSKTPLRVSGHGVAAQAMRTSPTQYQTQVSVALREPLQAGLSLRPARALEPFVELVTGRDLQLDDAPFDRAFTLHAEAPEIVRVALAGEVRGQLLELMQWGGVGFTDHGVTLHSSRHAEVPSAIQLMRAIARAVDENKRAALGPYR